jgi:hypothetical protein
MKVRLNKRRILINLSHNNKTHWYLTPFLIKAAHVKKLNERIRKLIDNV